MSEKSTAELLSALESSLAVPQPDEFVLQTSLNEAWFSNTLAWLLNPRGSHGFGVSFCEAFVALVARKRSERPSDPDSYVRRATFLKFDKAGPGVGATGFSFQNAAALREYYLSRSVDQRDDRRTRFCDVVLVDLDSHDSFFLAIENKLFTSDHDEQLREYRAAIEAKYERATVRELVYLTLCGDPPANDGAGQSERRHWVRLSGLTMFSPFSSNGQVLIVRLVRMSQI